MRLPQHRHAALLSAALTLGVTAATCVPATTAVAAAPVTVTTCADSGPGSLRDAVATPGATVTIPTTLGCTQITLTTGVLALANGVTVNGPGPDLLSVSGGGTTGVFHIAAGATGTITGLTARDAYNPGTSGWDGGGAILNDGTATVRDVVVRDNRSDSAWGSGVWNRGQLTLERVVITNNVGAHYGSGLYNVGNIVMRNSVISNNHSTGAGGGVMNAGSLVMSGSTVSGNRTLVWGAGIMNSSWLEVSTSSFTDNVVNLWGGALYSVYGAMKVTHSTFADNSSLNGWGSVVSVNNNASGYIRLAANVLTRNSGPACRVHAPDLPNPIEDLGHNRVEDSSCAGQGSGTVVAAVTGIGAALSGTGIAADGTAPVLPVDVTSSVRGAVTDPALCIGTDQLGVAWQTVCSAGSVEAGRDTTAPVLTGLPDTMTATASSAAGATVLYPEPAATDDTDGPLPVSCTPASGSTLPLGATTVTCSATDAAGNTGTAEMTVMVTVAWGSWRAPLNSDGSSVWRAGATVPVKFSLSNSALTDLPARFSATRVATQVLGTDAESVTATTATTGALFRFSDSGYLFNWSTKGLPAGTYRIAADLGDGVSHTVQVSLR